LINHALPADYLELIEKLMEFDEDTGEWIIQGFEEYKQHAKKLDPQSEEPKKILAMGFNDDEECN
jgi:hypothetical protein